MEPRIPIFDLDGTLVDTDEALVAPFVALGVRREDVTFGHVLADECGRLGIAVDEYLDLYDTDLAPAFPGIDTMIDRLDRWAVCSNKHSQSGHAELARLRWTPEVALFSESFDGPKRLGPVLAGMRLTPRDVVFIGDTAHDRAVAAELEVPFGLAAWNPRATAVDGDVVLQAPAQVWDFCAEPLRLR